MPPPDDDPVAFLDRLARAQLVARLVRRSPTLAPDERARLLHGPAVIEEAMHAQAALIVALRDRPGAGRNGRLRPPDRAPDGEP